MSGLKKLWGPLKGRWVKPEVREAVVELVDYGITRVGMPRKRLLHWLGLAPGKYYDWKRRQGQPNRHTVGTRGDCGLYWRASAGRLPAVVLPHDRRAQRCLCAEHGISGAKKRRATPGLGSQGLLKRSGL